MVQAVVTISISPIKAALCGGRRTCLLAHALKSSYKGPFRICVAQWQLKVLNGIIPKIAVPPRYCCQSSRGGVIRNAKKHNLQDIYGEIAYRTWGTFGADREGKGDSQFSLKGYCGTEQTWGFRVWLRVLHQFQVVSQAQKARGGDLTTPGKFHNVEEMCSTRWLPSLSVFKLERHQGACGMRWEPARSLWFKCVHTKEQGTWGGKNNTQSRALYDEPADEGT